MRVVFGRGDPHRFRRLSICRQECFDRQFRDGDIDRRREHRARFVERHNPVHRRQLQRDGDHIVVHWVGRRPIGWAWIFPDLLKQIHQAAVTVTVDLPTQPVDSVRTPLGQVDDAGCEAGRVQQQPHYIDGGTQQKWFRARKQIRNRAVCRHHCPAPIDGQRRVRVMCRQNRVHGTADHVQRGFIQGPFLEHRRKIRGIQQAVSATKGNIQAGRQAQQHLPAWTRSASFQKAKMLRRDAGIACQFKLTHSSPDAPFPQQRAKRQNR